MLSAVKAALDNTGLPFAFVGWSEAPDGDYGVVTPDGANDLCADGKHAETATEGTVDWFTRRYPAPAIATIQEALESLPNVAWSLNSVQFEDTTGYLHIEWIVQES